MGSQTQKNCDSPELVMDLRTIPGLAPDREGLYQKESLYNHYLPVPVSIQDKDSQAWLEEIKDNLAEAVMLRDLRPGLVTWLTRLSAYISLYDFKMSREEHVGLVRLVWSLMVTKDMEPRIIYTCIRVLLDLLKKRRLLTPNDLTLDWRHLWDIGEEFEGQAVSMSMKLYPADFEKSLKSLVKLARPYFPHSATKEILRELRPQFCPHDRTMTKAVYSCSIFLPTLFVERDPLTDSWKRSDTPEWTQWFAELMTFWRACPSCDWEGVMLNLMSRLAEDNLGSTVLWSQEDSAVIFQKMMHSLGLPVFYKKLALRDASTVTTGAIVRWIVWTISPESSSLDLLETMMMAISSFYHPTSEGRYSVKLVDLLSRLIHTFCSRLHRERHQTETEARTWVPRHPEQCHLTDEQILRFSNIVKPALMDLTMSKRYIDVARQCVSIMASIRPDIFLPGLVTKLETSLWCLTSPHKFTAAAKCLGSVARAHIIDILVSVLPGIDCNDIKKTMSVFQLISIYGRLVPMVDLTSFLSTRENLSPTEKRICQDSAKLRGFVTEFMDKCFTLVENSTLELIRQEQSTSDAHMSSEESSIHSGIVSCLHSVVLMADDDILDAVISKMDNFLKGRILEPKISGKIVAGMVRTLASVCPDRLLCSLVPRVCGVILEASSVQDLTSDQYLGDELMFNMLLLSEVLCVPGSHLVAHVGRVEAVLAKVLSIHNRDGHSQAVTILRNLLASLTTTCLADKNRIVAHRSEFPLDDWGASSDLSNLKIKWFVPGEKEFRSVTSLLDTLLVKEVNRLEGFIRTGLEATDKEELHRSLKTVATIIVGSSSFLHHWDEEPLRSVESQVNLRQWSHQFGLYEGLDYKYPGTENTRKMLADLMKRLVDQILKEREDDTKSLKIIINILELLIFKHSTSIENLEKHTKSFYQSKSKLEVKLFGKEKHTRIILMNRVLLQHERWMVECLLRNLTQSHLNILEVFVRLATSHYSKVRVSAQASLTRTLKQFPYSYSHILDSVLRLLNPGEANHEQFKGALFIILENQFLLKHSWTLQRRLWPALVRAQRPSEKPSITALIKSVSGYVQSLDTWTLTFPDIPEEVTSLAREICRKPPPSAEVIAANDLKVAEVSLENKRLYDSLVDSLCELAESGETLHWLNYNMSLTMLCFLTRWDVPLPPRAVKIFTDNLLHENIMVRKASFHVVDSILKQHKRKHIKLKMSELPQINSNKENGLKKRKRSDSDDNQETSESETELRILTGLQVRPGEREDNRWLQYSPDNRPLDQDSYDEPRYVNKAHLGFYTWPDKPIVYAPSSQQPRLDRAEEDMPEAERIVFRFFRDEAKVKKLMEFLSLENKKGQDRFDVERFHMWKALFRNFGDSFLDMVRPHVEAMVGDKRESYQRAASEVMAGLVRGAKHWDYKRVSSLWSWVIPAIRQALTQVSPETIRDWGTSFATSCDARDPNRLHWLLEVAMEEPIRSQGSFIDCSRLYMAQGVLAGHRWRVGEVLTRLLTTLKPFLDHPYHNVRSRLGGVLNNIFAYDLEFEGWGNSNKSSPHEADFLKETLPLLSVLKDPATSDVEASKGRDSGLRLLQTLTKWLCSSLAGPGLVRAPGSHLFSLLPYLLSHEWYETDPTLASDCQTGLTCLSRAQHTAATLPRLVQEIETTLSSENSWKTRLACLEFLQALVFNNLMLFSVRQEESGEKVDGDKLRTRVIRTVTDCLHDTQIEVRVKAAQVFGGMIHCKFIRSDSWPGMISSLRSSCDSPKPGLMVRRHGAILGLCSFINAFPHTVPSIIPGLLSFLGRFLHCKQPIPATIKKTVQNWKRTHTDNWIEHVAAFTEDQLAELTDLLVSPSYYA